MNTGTCNCIARIEKNPHTDYGSEAPQTITVWTEFTVTELPVGHPARASLRQRRGALRHLLPRMPARATSPSDAASWWPSAEGHSQIGQDLRNLNFRPYPDFQKNKEKFKNCIFVLLK